MVNQQTKKLSYLHAWKSELVNGVTFAGKQAHFDVVTVISTVSIKTLRVKHGN